MRWLSNAVNKLRGFLLLHLRAYALLTRLDLGRQRVSEVRGLEDLPDLDLRAIERSPLEPLNDFILRLRLDQPKARDQLVRLRKRAVADGWLAIAEPDARTLGARVQTFTTEHH